MSNFFACLFTKRCGHKVRPSIERAYVSEFTLLMDRFLAEHPEVLEDQHRGRLIYWDKKVDSAALSAVDRSSRLNSTGPQGGGDG